MMAAMPFTWATVANHLCDLNRCPACGAGVDKGGT
jgi:hypothetical protein